MFGYRAERRKISKLMGVDYLWFGLVGQFTGGLLIAAGSQQPAIPPMLAGELAVVLSTGVLIGGCAMYCRYHGLGRFCALLGLFSLFGVLILITLPSLRRQRERGNGFSVIFAAPYRRDIWRMDVRVKLDEKIGTGVNEPILLQIPRGANVGTAMKTLAGVIPNLHDGDLPNADFTVNGRRADRRAELCNGDEIVVDIIGSPDSNSPNVNAIACSAEITQNPHPNPLPEYQERGKEGTCDCPDTKPGAAACPDGRSMPPE